MSQTYPEFKKQQEEGALRAVRPLALKTQNPGERLDVKNKQPLDNLRRKGLLPRLNPTTMVCLPSQL